MEKEHKREVFKRKCSICGKGFETIYYRQNICGFTCQQIRARDNSRRAMRYRRMSGERYKPCVLCGFKDTTDRHNEGDKTYVLCPNHHCLITRGIKTIEQLFKEFGKTRLLTGQTAYSQPRFHVKTIPTRKTSQ